ncbi:MAG TPA: aldo/keto reductase [Bryobacteraceae bacterium]|nr:aldo/keto reductase [Bryobacteraceae bacterium]
MRQRLLGRDGLRVSSLGLGCMGMTGFYGDADEQEAIATLHRACDLGVTHFDTAEVYGPYTNEVFLGRQLAGRRANITIATKFGWRITDGKPDGVDSRPEAIRASVEGSLRRLGTDYIDLLYQHRLDRAVPIEEVVGAMADLVREGKVRYLGLSEVGVQTIRRAHAVHPIAAIQSEYSLWERGLEVDVLPCLRELGISLVAFAPLGRGFLTGNAKPAAELAQNDWRRGDPRLTDDNFTRNIAFAEPVFRVARRLQVPPAQIALAWMLHRADDIIPIPGTKRRVYLEQNVAAADLALSAEELRELNTAIPVAGERYGQRQLQYLDR